MTLSSRLRRNWALFNVNYVLSKSMSDDDNERDSGGVLYENTFDLGPEWGPARLDRRHQFNGYAVFFLPYNVDLSTGFRFLSGLPIDAAIGRDINNSLGGADRPYSAPGVPFQRNGFRDEPFKEVNFRAQWGPRFGGEQPRARHVRRVQRVRRGQHPALGRDHGHELLRRHRAGRLRLRRADESELPAGEGRQRELHPDEHPWCAQAGAARVAVRVLGSSVRLGKGLSLVTHR